MAKWYHFRPSDIEDTKSVYVQIADKELAKQFIRHVGYALHEFRSIKEYNTLDYATAKERGCAEEYHAGALVYKEEQKPGSPYTYMPLDKFEKSKQAKFFYLKDTNQFLDFLNNKPVVIEFDGCKCRECNGYKPMAEPDKLKKDGMFTCFICRDRLKHLKKFPYPKEQK